MPRRPRLIAFAGLLAPLVAAGGCSLIASYDAVRESPGGGDGGGGGADATLDAAGDDAAGGSDGAEAADGRGGEGADGSPAPEGGSDAGAAADGDAGASADAGPQGGAIVIAGTGRIDGGTGYVLSVLDPSTGEELSREARSVSGIAYDGQRDLWFVFDNGTAGTFLAGPAPITLRARQLDTHTGRWTDVGSLTVPPLVSGWYAAPLAGRLAYVAQAPPSDGGGAGEELVVVDTSNPAGWQAGTMMPSGVQIVPISFTPVGVIGSAAAGGTGGQVALLQNTTAGGDAGVFQIVTESVTANSVTPASSPTVIGPVEGLAPQLGFGAAAVAGQAATNVVVVPEGDAGATIAQYDPRSGTRLSEQTFPAVANRFDPVAVSSCAGVAFVGQGVVPGSAINYLFGIPLNGAATPAQYRIDNTSISNVAFEPFTSTVVATFSASGDNIILGLTASGGAAAPALQARSSSGATNPWNPPSDLQVTWIATRQPASFDCPSMP